MPRTNSLHDLSKLLAQRVDRDASHAEYLAQEVDTLFDDQPVLLETFLYDRKYLSLPRLSQKQYDFIEAGTQIYYASTLAGLGWKQLPYYRMLVAKWGKGSGKDTVSRIILARITYLLLCLKDPQKYLDIMPGDSINMLNVAYSARQAQEIFFEPLKRLLIKSLWFRDKINSPTEDRIKFIKEVNIVSGHSESESLEGHNLIAAVLDEIAAFKTSAELEHRQRRSVRALEHSADSIADMVTSSATSRFPYLHKIVYISYTRFQGDFIEQKYDEAIANPVYSFASFGATWEVNPTKKQVDFAEEYRRNPENARARYECKPPKAVDAYFKHLTPELIARVFPKVEEPLLDTPTVLTLKDWFRGIRGVNYFAHIDLGLSKDRAGICICHRSGHVKREIQQSDESGRTWVDIVKLPKIKIDVWTSLLAPPGGEVDFESIRAFLFQLHEKRNCRLQVVTFDQFQSADSIQMLRKRGIEADTMSIDRDTKCYDTLKDMIYSERLEGYYRELGIFELERLNIITGNKIDHPLTGSKDEADALAGSVYNASIAEVSDCDVSDFGTGPTYDELFAEYHLDEQPGIWTAKMMEGRNEF